MAVRSNRIQHRTTQTSNIGPFALAGLVLGIVIGLMIGVWLRDLSLGITAGPILGLLSGALLGIAVDSLESTG